MMCIWGSRHHPRRMHKPYKKRVRMHRFSIRTALHRALAGGEPRLTALAILGRLAEHSRKVRPPQHTSCTLLRSSDEMQPR